MESLELIMESSKTNGIVWTMLLALFWLLYKWLDKKLAKDIEKVGVEKNLAIHPFFDKMYDYINKSIADIKVEDPLRKKLQDKFLKIKFQTFSDETLKFIQQDLNLMSALELKSKTNKYLTDTINLYNDRCKLTGIPKLFIDKFDEWHNPHTEIVTKAIENTCNSTYFYTNTERMAIILDNCIVAFHDTIMDSELTLSSLNGKLTEWLNNNQETVKSWTI